ncbi:MULTISPECIES: ABC transporter substrate-binding protein [unclassified Nocardia]|uniref:ABC transporter substrate-binding protein n=1 Tax=unclassified Nocardia TaxID=2637762 RepID=UPI001CE48939|nr:MULTISPECIES: ABC transporter substrate-binding protein [unclassified Nocardia]
MVPRRALLQAGLVLPLASACGSGLLTGEPGMVRIAVPWSGYELAAFRKVLRDRRIDGVVEVLPLGDDIDLALDARGSSAPDIVLLPEAGRVRQLADSVLRPVDERLWLDTDGWRYADEWRNLLWHNGKPYGVPFKAANKSMVWYDRYAFGREPADEPRGWTLADWPRRMEEDFSARGKPRLLALGAADGWVLANMFSNVLFDVSLMLNGSPWDYEDLAGPGQGSWARTWDRGSVRATLAMLGRIWSNKYAFPGGVAQTLTRQFPDAVRDVFELRRAALVVAPDFAEPVVRRCLQRTGRPADCVGVMQFPPVAPGFHRPLIAGGDVITVTAAAREEAGQVVAALADPLAPLPWLKDEGGFLAPNLRTPIRVSSMVAALEPEMLTWLDSWTEFDLADLVGTVGRRDGLWRILTQFLIEIGDGQVDRLPDQIDWAIAELDRFERSSA